MRSIFYPVAENNLNQEERERLKDGKLNISDGWADAELNPEISYIFSYILLRPYKNC